MKNFFSGSFKLNSLLALFLLLLFSQDVNAQKSTMKVYVSTWQKTRATGSLQSITDSTITIKSKKGEPYTFSANNIRNLRIRKSNLALPFGVVGAVGAGVIINQLDNDVVPQYIVGIPVGFISGLIIGNLFATKVNIKRMHAQDFKKVRAKLER